MLVIGSRALSVWASFKGKPFRTPADLDVICSREEMMAYCGNDVPEPTGPGHFRVVNHNPKWGIVNLTEFDLTDDCPSSQAYVDYVRGLNMQTRPIVTAPLDVLYSLKRSHRFIPWQWHKNIGDYHLLKELMGRHDGCGTTHENHPLEDITKMRMAERAAIKALKTPSLNKSKKDFFDDHVSNHTFEHDDIHAVFAHREKPMFTYIAAEGNTVKSDKDKFLALLRLEKAQCVLEEAYAIAIERAIAPMFWEGKKLADAATALEWALMRICTTLCSGWFRNHAVEDFPFIQSVADPGYAMKFLQAVQDGKVRKIALQKQEEGAGVSALVSSEKNKSSGLEKI